ncbi:MAG: hypothetical protein ACJA1L_001580, partial [Paracoccaceae bacterium]
MGNAAANRRCRGLAGDAAAWGRSAQFRRRAFQIRHRGQVGAQGRDGDPALG